MRNLLLIPLLAFACASCVAQRGGAGAHFGARSGSHRGGHHRGWRGYPLGPLYWDSLFSDESFDSAPPAVVVQQPAAAQPQLAASASQNVGPVQPLLIELRNGRYVRVREEESSISENTVHQLNSDASPGRALEPLPPSASPPSTVLVFRDGSREQISDYTIADGVLYAQANYYTAGAWNQPIALSSLDLTATVNANRARGVRFQVPVAPNQVIVGP